MCEKCLQMTIKGQRETDAVKVDLEKDMELFNEGVYISDIADDIYNKVNAEPGNSYYQEMFRIISVVGFSVTPAELYQRIRDYNEEEKRRFN